MKVTKTEHFTITEVNEPELTDAQIYLLAHHFYKLIMADKMKDATNK